MNSQGSLIIISAPSGTGKTSLVSALRQNLPNLLKSVSHTTRGKREGEENGKHYNFVSQAEFNQMLAANVFLEHAEVFGNSYGTSRDWVTETLANGVDVILEIDWQGAQQIKRSMPDVVTVFILPPSEATLLQRLTDRKQDDALTIENRMRQAKHEVSHYTEYDYLIVNDDFGVALEQLKTIISAARLRTSRQKNVWQKLIEQLSTRS